LMENKQDFSPRIQQKNLSFPTGVGHSRERFCFKSNQHICFHVEFYWIQAIYKVTSHKFSNGISTNFCHFVVQMLNYNAQIKAVFVRQAPLLTYKCSLKCCRINRCVQ
jgi:hypothetical protein